MIPNQITMNQRNLLIKKEIKNQQNFRCLNLMIHQKNQINLKNQTQIIKRTKKQIKIINQIIQTLRIN